MIHSTNLGLYACSGGNTKVILESILIEKENARFLLLPTVVFEVTFKDGVLYENGKAMIKITFEYLDKSN